MNRYLLVGRRRCTAHCSTGNWIGVGFFRKCGCIMANTNWQQSLLPFCNHNIYIPSINHRMYHDDEEQDFFWRWMLQLLLRSCNNVCDQAKVLTIIHHGRRSLCCCCWCCWLQQEMVLWEWRNIWLLSMNAKGFTTSPQSGMTQDKEMYHLITQQKRDQARIYLYTEREVSNERERIRAPLHLPSTKRKKAHETRHYTVKKRFHRSFVGYNSIVTGNLSGHVSSRLVSSREIVLLWNSAILPGP